MRHQLRTRMIRIIEIGDIAWQGKTEPVFCRAENGREYVVKGRFAEIESLLWRFDREADRFWSPL